MERGQMESRFAEFAQSRIAARPELARQTEFPADLWRQMRKSGLFGVELPQRFGGHGKGAPVLCACARTLVENGGNLGLAMSWLIHEMTGRYLVWPFGTAQQHKQYLAGIAAGKITACLAVSEPDAGAHPKYLKTTAVQDGSDYRLTGTKTYLTNGPIADLFIVIAATDTGGPKKRYTAFLVPKDAPGLAIEAPMTLSFLRPAPHGTIRLDNCPAGAAQILGPVGFAYDTLVLPFREIEDVLMTGVLTGGLGFQIGRLRAVSDRLDASGRNRLFDSHLALCGLRAAAEKAALYLETEAARAELVDLGLYFRSVAKNLADELQQLNSELDHPDPRVEQMAADLSGTFKIGASAMQARRRKRVEDWLG